MKKHPVSEAERKAADKPAKKHILEKGRIKITIFDEKVRSILKAAEN